MTAPTTTLRAQSAAYLKVVFSRGFGTGCQFLAQVVIGQLLGPAVVGTVSVMQSWVSLLATIGGVGTPTFVLRRTAHSSDGRAPIGRMKWLQFGLVTSAAAAGATTLLFAILALYAPQVLGSEINKSLIVPIVLGALGYSAARIYLEDLKGRDGVERSMLLEFAAPFIFVGLAIPGVRLLPEGGQKLAVAFAYAVPFVAIGAWSWFYATQEGFLLRPRNWWRRLQRSKLELTNLTGVLFGNQALTALPVILLAGRADLATVGALGIAMRLIGLTSTISATLSGYYTRRVINAYRSRNGAGVAKLYWTSLLANGALSAAVLLPMIIAPHLFLSLFGKGMATPEAALGLQILAGFQIVRQFMGLSQVFLMNAGKSRFDAVSQSVAVIVMLLLMCTGILPLTLATAAFAAGAASTVRSLMSLCALHLTLRPLKQG